MASRYHYKFGVFESMMRDSGEDDEGRLTTVKMLLWKKLDESSSPVELVGSIEFCYVHLDAAQNVVKDLHDCLGQIGVPLECHARMIAKLMQYIESQVTLVVDGRRRYESETVVMNIFEASSFGAIVAEERVAEVFWRFLEFVPRGWYSMDLGVYESWAWPEEAEGDIAQAVEILRALERSTNVTVERSRRDDVVSQSMMEEYVIKMVPASEAAIASLEKVEQEGEVALLCCMICMHKNEDEDGDEELGFSRMPCKHEFHTMCIETWLRISSSCPLCRYTVPS